MPPLCQGVQRCQKCSHTYRSLSTLPQYSPFQFKAVKFATTLQSIMHTQVNIGFSQTMTRGLSIWFQWYLHNVSLRSEFQVGPLWWPLLIARRVWHSFIIYWRVLPSLNHNSCSNDAKSFSYRILSFHLLLGHLVSFLICLTYFNWREMPRCCGFLSLYYSHRIWGNFFGLWNAVWGCFTK